MTLQDLLEKLGVPDAGPELAQNAIYLAQAIGADVGYRFFWIDRTRWPESPLLAADLAMASKGLGPVPVTTSASGGLLDTPLAAARVVLGAAPADVAVASWANALARLHHMVACHGHNADQAWDVVEEVRPDLEPILRRALATLEALGLEGRLAKVKL